MNLELHKKRTPALLFFKVLLCNALLDRIFVLLPFRKITSREDTDHLSLPSQVPWKGFIHPAWLIDRLINRPAMPRDREEVRKNMTACGLQCLQLVFQLPSWLSLKDCISDALSLSSCAGMPQAMLTASDVIAGEPAPFA